MVDRRVFTNVISHLFERLQLSFANQIEFADEIVKVFVAGVDVSFCADRNKSVKVMDVHLHL